MRVVLHPEARSEIRSAALWYDERRPGFGDRLLERLNEAFGRIVSAPEAYAVWPATASALVPIRRAAIEQFPYSIAFEVHPDHVPILAIAHDKRQPLYWLARATTDAG